MKIHVRHFAVLREQRGCELEEVEVAPGTTAAALYDLLFPPGLEGQLPVLFAVNQAYVARAAVLVEGDEVAFIPPLGGG